MILLIILTNFQVCDTVLVPLGSNARVKLHTVNKMFEAIYKISSYSFLSVLNIGSIKYRECSLEEQLNLNASFTENLVGFFQSISPFCFAQKV